MKFSLVAFVVALGLLTVTVHASEGRVTNFEMTRDYKLNTEKFVEEIMQIESRSSSSSSILSVLRKVLYIYTDFNSTIDEVMAIRDVTANIVKELTECENKLSEKSLSLIYTCNQIHHIYKDIVNFRECIYNYKDKEITTLEWKLVPRGGGPQNCIINVLLNILSLRKKAIHVAELIIEILEIAIDDQCVLNSVDTFGQHLMQLSSNFTAYSIFSNDYIN